METRAVAAHAPVGSAGRAWRATGDIDDIYARASLEEHASASVGLANAGQGVSLEEANPGWVQPSTWRRT